MPHTHPGPARRTAAWRAATLLACSLLPVMAWAQTAAPAHTADAATVPAPACVQVEVQSLRPGQGYLMLAAFGSADSFGKQPLAARRVPVGAAQMRIEWCGLKGEAVALMGFQDLDSDGKMGRNLVGIPTEPWGSSGQPGSFGPSWETGRVPLNGQAIVVRMSQ